MFEIQPQLSLQAFMLFELPVDWSAPEDLPWTGRAGFSFFGERKYSRYQGAAASREPLLAPRLLIELAVNRVLCMPTDQTLWDRNTITTNWIVIYGENQFDQFIS